MQEKWREVPLRVTAREIRQVLLNRWSRIGLRVSPSCRGHWVRHTPKFSDLKAFISLRYWIQNETTQNPFLTIWLLGNFQYFRDIFAPGSSRGLKFLPDVHLMMGNIITRDTYSSTRIKRHLYFSPVARYGLKGPHLRDGPFLNQCDRFRWNFFSKNYCPSATFLRDQKFGILNFRP